MALIEDGAVPLSNGRLAIDHPSAIQFTSGRVVDATSYDFYNPCPPTSQRIAIYDAARTSAGKATFVVQKAPDDIARDFQVAKYTVSKEDRDFHTSLLCIVGNGQLKNSFTLKSGGSGRALIPLLCAYEKKSTPTDRALVKTELVNFEKAGLQGELNLESLNLHYDDYEISWSGAGLPAFGPMQKKRSSTCRISSTKTQAGAISSRTRWPSPHHPTSTACSTRSATCCAAAR